MSQFDVCATAAFAKKLRLPQSAVSISVKRRERIVKEKGF